MQGHAVSHEVTIFAGCSKFRPLSNACRSWTVAKHPIVNGLHLRRNSRPCKLLLNKLASAIAHLTEFDLFEPSEAVQSPGNGIAPGLDLNCRPYGKSLWDIALRGHKHRFSIRPGLERRHRQPFAERGEDERRRPLKCILLGVSEEWSRPSNRVGDAKLNGSTAQSRFICPVIPTCNFEFQPQRRATLRFHPSISSATPFFG